jgi:hypothetical protein
MFSLTMSVKCPMRSAAVRVGRKLAFSRSRRSSNFETVSVERRFKAAAWYADAAACAADDAAAAAALAGAQEAAEAALAVEAAAVAVAAEVPGAATAEAAAGGTDAGVPRSFGRSAFANARRAFSSVGDHSALLMILLLASGSSVEMAAEASLCVMVVVVV